MLESVPEGDPQGEAEMLLAEVLNTTKSDISNKAYQSFKRHQDNDNDLLTISNQEWNIYKDMILRRTKQEPIQYIIGKTWFYGRQFSVIDSNYRVLIPRWDTETLVLTALQNIGNSKSVLEVGVGSGCLITTICAEVNRMDVRFIGTDIDAGAIAIAQKNSYAHNTNVNFILHDILNQSIDQIIKINHCEPFDIVISNPPYISTKEVESLEVQVRDFEPKTALDGGSDGLLFYKKLSMLCKGELLKTGGKIIVEIGYTQAQQVTVIFQEEIDGVLLQVDSVEKDMSGNDRIITATKVVNTKSVIKQFA
ncbi:release factor glutamine methyltransferase [Acrasis kona]|uniref:peptide chain release factor N(5)-glutamine methyltransferase n=1 Tax=Acrasis kona TaxID=1008807 RepID=A0AAW2ZC12_9EUKA